MTMTSQFSRMTFMSDFLTLFLIFWRCHGNIITGSGVMTIFFYKRLTRNIVIENTPIWVLLNIWRLGHVRGTKFCTNVSNKTMPNAAKCQVTAFTASEINALVVLFCSQFSKTNNYHQNFRSFENCVQHTATSTSNIQEKKCDVILYLCFTSYLSSVPFVTCTSFNSFLDFAPFRNNIKH